MFRSRALRQREGVSPNRPLVSCPACSSALIQIDCCHPAGTGGAVLERHCPECGHEDELAVAVVVADVLMEHAGELAVSLEVLADRLEAAAELWISR